MVKHGCGLTQRAPMFKLSRATKLNEFEFDARSAKRAFEVPGVLHARLASRGRSWPQLDTRPKVLFYESDSARG